MKLLLKSILLSSVVGLMTSPLLAESPKGRVLFVLSSHSELGDTGKETGFFLSEATHPYHVLTEAGIAVDFVSPEGGAAPKDGVDMTDEVNQLVMQDEAFVEGITHTMKPSDVDISLYDGIHFVGGHGTMWDFADNSALQEMTRTIYENGGVVSAVCHGPAGLVNVTLSDGKYLVEGKQVAAFTNKEEEAVGLTEVVPFLLETTLRERGALIVPAENFTENVVVDGRLVTGQNPASATALGKAIVALIDQKKSAHPETKPTE